MTDKHQINLLPKDSFEESNLGKFLKWAISIGRWVVVFTDLIVICAFLSRFYFDTRLDSLHDDIKESQAIVEATSGFENSFRLLQERLKLIKVFSQTKTEGRQKIDLLAQILPNDIVLTSVSFSESKAEVSGTAASQAGMEVFVKNLLALPQIKNLSFTQFSQKDKGQGNVITFSFSADWKAASPKSL